MTKKKWSYWLIVVLIIIVILFLLKTCGSNVKMIKRKDGDLKPETAYRVPVDATLILSLNLESILPEIGYSELIKTSQFKNKMTASYPTNPAFTNVFSDPQNQGINISKKAVFYVSVGKSKSEVYSATILCIKDVNKFNVMMQKTPKGKVKNTKHYDLANLGNNNSCAWNDEFAMFLTTNPDFDVEAVCDQVFNPSFEKYFDRSTDYMTFTENSKSDVAFWVDLESYSRNQLHATGKPGELPSVLLEGNTVFGEVDFETGFFETEIQFKLNKILSEGIKGFFKDDEGRTITKYVPLENPSFVANLSLNIDGLFSFLLKDTDRKVEARNSLAKYGLLTEDFGKALTGDVLLAGFPNDTTSKSSVLFGVKIKDSDYFFKLLKVMEDVGQIEMIENNLYKMNQGVVPFYPLLATYEDMLQRLIIKDGYAFVSLDKRIIEAMKIYQPKTNDLPSFLLPLTNQYNYFSFYGNESFNETNQYTGKFSVKDYFVNYNGNVLKIKCNLKNNQISSLKQMLSI